MFSNFIYFSELYFSNFSKVKFDKVNSFAVIKKLSSFSKKFRSLKLNSQFKEGFENSKLHLYYYFHLYQIYY